MPFVHLHVHSHYSLLDGMPKISELVDKAVENKMSALALTDHGAMYGIIEFYKECKKASIKPIIGMEAYISPILIDESQSKTEKTRYHLTIVAKNYVGYQNLMQLTTIGWLKGFYYKPRIDKYYLKKYGEGLIILSGCGSGDIPRALLNNDEAKAEELVKEYQDIAGKDNFYLEIQDHPKDENYTKIKPKIIALAKKLNIRLAATNDVHYLNPQDKQAQDVLLCIQTGKKVEDEKRMNMLNFDVHFTDESEMRQKFYDTPEAIDNTHKISEECNVEIKLGKWVFPTVEVPKDLTQDEYLRQMTYDGLKKRLLNSVDLKSANNQSIKPHYQKRVEEELEIIKHKGYAPYFIAIADIADFIKKHNIIATTRGSAAGSLVSYAIGITTADPMNFNLPFERFLNPYRPTPPDIDLDIEDLKRTEIIQFVQEKYGSNKVAHIITFGTLMARAAVRDVGRVLNFPYSFCDKLAKMIPLGHQGSRMTLERAMSENPNLKQVYKENEDVKKIIDIARQIEGCVRHASVHAAGIVIAPIELTHFTPLQRDSSRGGISTQYDMNAIEDAGLLKIDLLGITNLSILGLAVKIIKRTRDINIDLNNIPLNDKKTFALLADGKTMGVFQLSGSGITRYLKELKPESIFDIMAMISLFRPGPMESIPEYIKRKHNPALIAYPHPKLKEILKMSYGVITYQDDVLLTSIELAGYNWQEADKLRKAIGKKIPKEMIDQKSKFITGCIKTSGLTKEEAERIWKLIEPFAAYGFNKAHGSSYALVAYQTAYIKANYPVEFMAAFLTCESDNLEKVAEGIAECEHLGIQVLPSDINESLLGFTVVEGNIRFGLNAIKHLAKITSDQIIEERKNNDSYKTLDDFLTRITILNKKSLEALVRSGAMDRFGDRAMLDANIGLMLDFGKRVRSKEASSTISLFHEKTFERKIELRERLIKDEYTLLTYEKEYLGLYISSHPLSKFKPYIQCLGITNIKDIIQNIKTEESIIKIFGIVSNIKSIITKKGELMLFAKIEDLTGAIEIVVFPRLLKQNSEIFKNDSVILIEGTVSAKDEEVKILANKASLFSEDDLKKIKQNNKVDSFYITLPARISRSKLEKLKNVISKYPGEIPVYLRIDDVRVKIIQTNLKVSLDNSIKKEIEAVLTDYTQDEN